MEEHKETITNTADGYEVVRHMDSRLRSAGQAFGHVGHRFDIALLRQLFGGHPGLDEIEKLLDKVADVWREVEPALIERYAIEMRLVLLSQSARARAAQLGAYQLLALAEREPMPEAVQPVSDKSGEPDDKG